MTVYASSSFWYAQLVGGLTGLDVTRHFLKVVDFVKICHFRQKKRKFLKIDIIGIWRALHIKNCAWVDLRFGMSYELVAKPENFWWIFYQREWVWSTWPEKGRFYQFLCVNYKKIVNFFLKNFNTKIECLSFLSVLVSVTSL